MSLNASPTTIADVTARVPVYDTKWGSHQFGTQGNTNAWAKCTYYIDYINVVRFMQLINGVFIDPDGNGGTTTTYKLPMTCPIWSGILVSDSQADPFYVDDTCDCDNPYKMAEVQVTFSTPKFQQSGDETLLSVEYEVADEIVSLPGSSYSFADGTRGETGIGLPVTTQGILITRYRVPVIDIATHLTVAGKVNSTPFFGYAPGHVLCGPIRSSSQQQFGGVTLNTAGYGFKARSIPWKKAINPNTLQWEDYSPQVLQSADLSVLFNS